MYVVAGCSVSKLITSTYMVFWVVTYWIVLGNSDKYLKDENSWNAAIQPFDHQKKLEVTESSG